MLPPQPSSYLCFFQPGCQNHQLGVQRLEGLTGWEQVGSGGVKLIHNMWEGRRGLAA